MENKPDDINVILATDCGSTTTKAILIEKREGAYRLIARGEAPTTVEAPFEDVTMGVLNAVAEVGELSGRTLLDENDKIITPAAGEKGCDIYISTSSAGGGLQMMVAGVVRSMTAESAERAALGAGAIVMDVIASNDKRRPHQQIERIRHLRPDLPRNSCAHHRGFTKKRSPVDARILRVATAHTSCNRTARLPHQKNQRRAAQHRCAGRGAFLDGRRGQRAQIVRGAIGFIFIRLRRG